MVREKTEIEVIVCDFCGYRAPQGAKYTSFLIIDKCIKCGRDFCPRCGDFGKDKQFICNECKRPSKDTSA